MFQSTIVKKYITTQNSDELISKWDLFKTFFHDIGNQNRIRELKEEQFQEGFLDKLFVEVFGYIKKPLENYNLVTELKNPNDSRKVDGGIIFNEVVKCVIELKGTNTTDLGRVEVQAFSYKNNQPNCKYIVTSNFEKLRFYIEDATEFLEFNLFELTQDEFDLMYLCLSSKSVESDIPLKLKSESLSQEDLITKKLYKDYSIFKRELFNNLIELNQGYDKLLLFKKSQKLLDRFLFLFFGEDKFLLPPNSVRLILDDWKDLLDKDVEISLYDRFKKYFGYLNTGFKGKRYDVFPYNGGLFKPDDVLDNILIDDELLYNHTKKLSEYDFESEVDVNILGHIFENSLNEIEEISNELISGEVVKSTSKRKKDGVFYTPKYITKYIVDNTIGKLCDEKKNELQINDEDYITDKKRIKKTIKGLSDKLNEYRNWLLELTICDPSCGSGAFLNQSLDFLIKEHRYVDELQSKLFGDSLVLSDIENSILENNLFGVDINEESVEITKLSLWLRTAQPNRKLNSLSDNIKCGNSLIDEPIEGVENYFRWEEEFPKVYEKGGFNVVIGNPPWGAELKKVEKDYLKIKFPSIDSSTPNSFTYFMGLCHQLSDIIGLVIPDSYLLKDFEKTRRLFTDGIENLVWYQNSSMPDSIRPFPQVDHDVISFTFFKQNTYKTLNYSLNIYTEGILKEINFKRFKKDIIEPKYFSVYNLLLNDDTIKIKKKLIGYDTFNSKTQVHEGIHSGNCRDKLFIKNQIRGDEKPLYYGGRNGDIINNYYSQMEGWYVDYRKDVIDKETGDYASLRNENIFKLPKVYITRTGNPFKCFIDNNNYASNNFFSLQLKDLENNSYELLSVFVCILNSKLSQFYIRNFIAPRIGSSFVETKIIHLLKLPLPEGYYLKSKEFLKIVNETVEQRKLINQKGITFLNYLQSQFTFDNFTNKLKNWYTLSFGEFIKELNKSIEKQEGKKLTKIDEMGWMDVFETKKSEIQILKTEIDITDREIDTMVYKLYNLTDEEIQVIESTI